MRRFFGVIAAAGTIAGAAFAAEPPAAALEALVLGRSSRPEVEAALGPPAYVDRIGDGRSVLLYDYEAAADRRMTVQLVLDARGVLQARRSYVQGDEGEGAPSATPGALPAAGGFDPYDPAGLRRLNWTAITQEPMWRDAPSPAPDLLSADPHYETIRKISAPSTASLSLQRARDGSRRYRLALSANALSNQMCEATREKLTQAYGAPDAERRYAQVKPLSEGELRVGHKDAQWEAGGALIVQSCRAVSGPSFVGHTVTLHVSAAADAPPLSPVLALSCRGLLTARLEEELKGPELAFDPYEGVVSSREGRPVSLLKSTRRRSPFRCPGPGRSESTERPTPSSSATVAA
jgi:hypothetical protein